MTNSTIKTDAVLNLSKPIGWSSFDVVRWTKRKLGGKVGHAGTLDPLATGVLLVCAGKATKKVPELMGQEKEYEFDISLGIETDSFDLTGNVVKTLPIPLFSDTDLAKLAEMFTGTIEQVPPIFSALRVNGKRSYHLARSGKDVKLEPRTITIYDMDFLRVEKNMLTIKVACSKGTYIRSLARDMAEKLGTAGFVRRLVRTRVGEYSLSNSIKLNEIKPGLGNQ